MIEAGARMVAARARWISTGAAAFRRYYEGISGGVSGDLSYTSSVLRSSGRTAEAGKPSNTALHPVETNEIPAGEIFARAAYVVEIPSIGPRVKVMVGAPTMTRSDPT